MDNICDLLLEHFVNHSTSIAFPELIFPVCLRVGLFISYYLSTGFPINEMDK